MWSECCEQQAAGHEIQAAQIRTSVGRRTQLGRLDPRRSNCDFLALRGHVHGERIQLPGVPLTDIRIPLELSSHAPTLAANQRFRGAEQCQYAKLAETITTKRSG